jgi:uncharacterized protein YdaL
MSATRGTVRGRRGRAALVSVVSLATAGLLVTSAGVAAAAPHPVPAPTTTTEVGAEAEVTPLPAPPRPGAQPKHQNKPLPSSTTRVPTGTSSTTSSSPQATAAAAAPAALSPTPQAAANGALVLYDSTNTFGWLGELYGQQSANLVSHFGNYKALPVVKYTAGLMANYSTVVYVGSTYDEPLPAAFLADVLATTQPVVWMGSNIWQLTNASPTFAATYGWNWTGYDFATVNKVTYKGQTLERDGINNQSGIMNLAISDATKATVLAQSVRADNTTFPWATRAKNLTYIGEVPYAYEGMSDRYLVASDLLFDALAPATAARHRALVRIEDVGPDADPAELRAVADTLSGLGVPFSFAVYPLYKDPLGALNNGVPVTTRLRDVPQVVSAIRYMISKGGNMINHGYTHQFGSVANPYDGVSANDFEFYKAHVDASDNVILDGPVPGDSQAWATGRLTSAAAEFTAAGLAVPTIWEFPHYAASVADYKAVAARFTTRYERSLYFGGLLSGGAINYSRVNGQFFPYVVKDLYGTKVLPENIGNIEPDAFNNHPARLPADLIASAKANLVVRDGFASFFYHPYLGTAYLRTTVTGIKALGYTFVAPGTL